jgi:uncharacterized protein (TIGR03437 family)
MLKYCALLSLCAGVSLAADFVTGQAARLVVGQTTFTRQEAGASDILLGGVGGVAVANGRLFIADSNRLGFGPINNRVLIMDTTGFPKAADDLGTATVRCPVCVGQASVVLGQPDFTSTGENRQTDPTILGQVNADTLRLAVGVATDGTRLVVADTLNNRVLIWNSIPTVNGQPADVVVGQPKFDQLKTVVTDSKSLRAPQGVWIQNGRLFVADTQNHRVLIWNAIPTSNEQAANLVLGQVDFNSSVNVDPIQPGNVVPPTTQSSLLSPTSVSTDGIRLIVTDLGLNRVLIWNTIPTRNNQPADVVIGQPDFTQNTANNSSKLCNPNDSNGDGVPDTDANGNIVYPNRCGKTLNFPRFALSDGQRLFLADGGNDRVLIYNSIPIQNGAGPDIILGQPDEFQSVVSSTTDLFHPLLRQSASDIIATPTSLAWDGTNLYVTDASNRRVLVFTAAESLVPLNGVRNAASREVFALGSVAVTLSSTINSSTGQPVIGKITAGDTATVTLNGRDYTYTVVTNDTLDTIMSNMADLINAGTGDPDVIAKFEQTLELIKLQAKRGGTDGNDITLTTATSVDAGIAVAASGTTLQGGGNAGIIAPGTLVTIYGSNLAATTAAADTSQVFLPTDLGGVQIYFDGIRSPLLYVSSNQINAQIPYEIADSNNVSFYLRLVRSDGSIVATTAIGVPIDQSNPGLFAEEGDDPRTGIAYHNSSYATGTITVDGSVNEGDVATVTIDQRGYTYTVKADDTLDSVRDALVGLINANSEESVVAVPVSAFHRIQLRAKVGGPAGEGINYSATSNPGSSGSVFLILTVNSVKLCCSNVAGTRVTLQNPAVPGETIYIYGTGLGLVDPEDAQNQNNTGQAYSGPLLNTPKQFVSSLANGTTANVISAALEQGGRGLYRVVLELGAGTTVGSNKYAGLTISQNIYTSNTVNIPITDPVKSTQLPPVTSSVVPPSTTPTLPAATTPQSQQKPRRTTPAVPNTAGRRR